MSGGGKSATAYLTRGAHIRCQYGTHGRYLNLPVDHGVYASGHPVMHEKDCVLGKHISSFGICRSCHNPDRSKITMASETGGMITGTPCRPRLNGKWLGTVAATTVGEGQTAYNALSTASFLPCYQGAGLIAPQNSGQQRTGIVTASVQRQVVGELRGITIEDSPVPLAGAMVVATNALAANSSKDMVDLLEENLPSVKDTFVANGETYYNLQEIFSLLGGTVTIGDRILGSIADVNGNALRLEGSMYTLPWYAVEKHVASVVDITTTWAGAQNERGEFDSMFIQIKAKAKKVYATKSELMKWFKIAFRHEGSSGSGPVAEDASTVGGIVNMSEGVANASPSEPSDKLIAFIALYEEFRAMPYRGLDSQNRTVGYGHVITASDGDKYDNGITEAAARELIMTDIKSVVSPYLNSYLNNNSISLTQQQYDALVSFTFNAGQDWIYKYRGLRDILESGDIKYNDMHAEFMTWIYVNGERELGLYRRRMDELNIFFKGDYTRNYPGWPDGF